MSPNCQARSRRPGCRCWTLARPVGLRSSTSAGCGIGVRPAGARPPPSARPGTRPRPCSHAQGRRRPGSRRSRRPRWAAGKRSAPELHSWAPRSRARCVGPRRCPAGNRASSQGVTVSAEPQGPSCRLRQVARAVAGPCTGGRDTPALRTGRSALVGGPSSAYMRSTEPAVMAQTRPVNSLLRIHSARRAGSALGPGCPMGSARL